MRYSIDAWTWRENKSSQKKKEWEFKFISVHISVYEGRGGLLVLINSTDISSCQWQGNGLITAIYYFYKVQKRTIM